MNLERGIVPLFWRVAQQELAIARCIVFLTFFVCLSTAHEGICRPCLDYRVARHIAHAPGQFSESILSKTRGGHARNENVVFGTISSKHFDRRISWRLHSHDC